MTDIVELDSFDAVPLIDPGERVRGGDENQPANKQARALANRTLWLRNQLGKLNGVSVLGSLATQADLDAIPTGNLLVGNAYFVSTYLSVWNGAQWVTSNDLMGPRGITFLGKWPDNMALPDASANVVGDAYIWNADIWLLIPSPDNWVSLGLEGPQGKDNYQLWQDAGHTGTLDDYLSSLIGKSNFEIWKDLGNTGTEQDFLDSLKVQGDPGKSTFQLWLDAGHSGTFDDFLLYEKGDKGDPATPFAVAGVKADTASLPRPGVATEAWYVGIDLYVWVDASADYVMIPGEGGKSSYDLWLAAGNTGSLTDFFEAWRGPQGKSNYQLWLDAGNNGTLSDYFLTQKGDKGDPGKNLNVLGIVADSAALPANPADQDGYVANDTGHLWVYRAALPGWLDLGPFRGKDAYDTWLANGNTGTEQDFLLSLKGVDGKDGTNIIVKGVVATFADLPASPVDQDCYAVSGESAIYMWLNAAWSNMGIFKGQDGVDGKSLIVKDVLATYADLPANPVDQDCYAIVDQNALYLYVNAAWKNMGVFKGQDGKDGIDGKDGASIDVVKVLTDADQTIPDATLYPGKAYVDLNHEIWISIGGVWKYAGTITQGAPGLPGTPIQIKGTVTDTGALPSPVGLQDGIAYFTAVDKMLYIIYSEQWTGPFDITGLKGDKGDQGIQGLTGASVNILGSYPSLAALAGAHPTGSLGDGYLIGTDLDPTPTNIAFWSNTNGGEWIDGGNIRGPQGIQGPPGVGLPGPKGDRGPRGTSWLTLPAGMDAPPAGFTGSVGDWAVSYNFKVYYYSAQNGWEFWGDLVAGDVTSPLLAAGKVVRLGDQWVPLLVDEVPNLQDGKLYVRIKQAGTDPIGTWAELDVNSLTAYTVSIVTATTELDLSAGQVFSIDNPSARTLTIKAGTQPASGRSATYVILLNGPGAVTFGFTVTWLGQPPQIGATVTVITLLWDGVANRWLGKDGGSA